MTNTNKTQAARCAEGEIDNKAYDPAVGGNVCAGCGRHFGGHGLVAFNAHIRAARKQLIAESAVA